MVIRTIVLRQNLGNAVYRIAGAKAGLRPIYDELLKIGLKIGKYVKACPGKTIVPLYRNHVFAQIRPATNTRYLREPALMCLSL